MSAIFRWSLGGQGAPFGVLSILCSSAIGMLLWRQLPPRGHVLVRAAIVAFAASDTFLITVLLLPGVGPLVAFSFNSLALIGLTFCATLAGAVILRNGQILSAERELIRAALRHSPN